ncbi:hypothetical protein AHAS_Ahas17G0323400 [Arachis hypogaea]
MSSFPAGKIMCYRKFFDTFGDSIQKCIHSVRFAPGDRSSNSYGERGSAREPCIPPGLGSGTAISRFPCSRQLVLDRSDQVFIIWSKRIRTFACRYQKPMPYHLNEPNGEPLNLEVGLEERAVQERGDIASKQQVLPSRTDYNKLATLI